MKRLVASLLALLLLCGCGSDRGRAEARYDLTLDTELPPLYASVSETAEEECRAALETYQQVGWIDGSLTLGPVLPVLTLYRRDSAAAFAPADCWLGLALDKEGKAAQCVFVGELKGDVQKGYGGDYERYALELGWAEREGLRPLAYVDIGAAACIPVLLAEDAGGAVRLLWYEDTDALSYAAGENLYICGVTEDAAWSFAEPQLLAEGYGRYLEACDRYPGNYLGLQWLSEAEAAPLK